MKTPISQVRGIALVVTLAVLVIVAILVVGFATVMRVERATARNGLDAQRAGIFAQMGADHAIGLIRESTTLGSAQGKFWSSQPGKITVFNTDGSVDATSSRNLYSVDPAGTNTTINLNQISFGGSAPIASTNAAGGFGATINAQWINVLENPVAAAGTNNKVVGRYAFWVDDETAKININAADGVGKYSGPWYGSGTPADVSLEALKDGVSGNISTNIASGIALRSGIHFDAGTASRFFNSSREVQQVSGASTFLFEDNDCNITHYSRAPEINIFGEPRIYLTPIITTSSSGIQTVNNAMIGNYDYTGVGSPGAATEPKGLSLTQVYPTGSQLPNFSLSGSAIPQAFEYERGMNSQLFSTTSSDYNLGYRIARYLKGFDSQGNAVKWPVFPGSSANGFTGKYTDRQIDSIALQILSLMKRGVMADHWRAGSLPYIMPKGWLSQKPVRGLGRGPKVNEILMQVSATPGTVGGKTVALVNIKIYVEWYLPKEFLGYDLANPYDANGSAGYNYGSQNGRYFLNYQDAPGTIGGSLSSTPADPAAPAPLGGFWMDNMLRIEDGSGQPAGIDLFGNKFGAADPDQTKAALYHPWTLYSGTNAALAGKYVGSGPVSSQTRPILQMTPMADNRGWKLGEYHCSRNLSADSFYPTKPAVTTLAIKGGLAIWSQTASGGEPLYNIDPVPLDSIRGKDYTNEDPTAIRAQILAAVVPIPDGVTIPVPGQVILHFQVADPWVNSMPGDWVATINPPASEITMGDSLPTDSNPTYYFNGRNTIATAANQADPNSLWWPQQAATITKSQRFPSVGYLQYIRTGMMPDKATEPATDDPVAIAKQKGTPFRMLNFAPSNYVNSGTNSQKTDGGESYPDWAMLDLFTVPAALQPLTTGSPYTSLTLGGATAGRVNPNIPVLFSGTFARTAPMEGVMKNQNTYTAISDSPTGVVPDEKALAVAINTYLGTLGRPLMMAGEICNVPEVANYLYQGVDKGSISRNDLVRQTVGNLTTRSNTYTVWAVGQALNNGIVTGESRMQFLVERYLDLGVDGVPGNAKNPGPDGVVGTADDPVDPSYNPAMTYPLPYKYRVVSMREITN
ncbi:hypothetical protein BH09VER1_BH09VER1_07240 [soil metagenome]